MRLSADKILNMAVSRSRGLFPSHPDFFIGNIALTSGNTFRLHGALFERLFTFEKSIGISLVGPLVPQEMN